MDGMRISQLAARSGVPVSTLRFYESEGLLPAGRAENGYRVYGEAAVDRLAFINQAKSLPLPLTEIRELVLARDAEPCRAVRTRYRPMLDQHAVQVEARITQLRQLQSAITQAQRHLSGLPDRETPCDASCSFLHHPTSAPTAQPETPMIKIDTAEAISCSLDGDDYAERAAAWQALIADTAPDRGDDGLRFRLPVDRLEAATALAVAEQHCCSFYRFSFELHGSHFDLVVSAPPEAAGLLSELFGQDAS